jgi:hypothetical protein
MKVKIFAIIFMIIFIIGLAKIIVAEGDFLSIGEAGQSILNLFPNSSAVDIVTSNSEYDVENKMLYIEEGGSLEIKTKDKEGNIKELIYDKIKSGIFIFDENGTISAADITTSGASTYVFGNYSPIKVENNTRIEYKKGILKISRGNGHLQYGNLSIDNFGDYIDLNGNQIICESCRVGEIDIKGIENKAGILEKADNGYLLEFGNFTYRQNFLSINDSLGLLLIANPDADMSHYNGNWFRQTADRLEMKSSNRGDINLGVLEGHDIFNTDAKDLLSLNVENGDGLKVEKRADEGLVPMIIQESSENGETKINNDKMSLELTGGEMYMRDPLPISFIDVNKKYQSVALEIQTDSPTLKNIRINAYSQFVLLGKNNKEFVSYNKFDLPVSALIQDNSLQTIGQLRQKYPNLNINTPLKTEDGSFKNEFNEENLPPYFIYLTDQFFQQNPDAVKNIGEIRYESWDNAAAAASAFVGIKPLLIIGNVVDPNEMQNIGIREQTVPMQILTHEYEHVKDEMITQKEFVRFPNAPESKTLQGTYNKIIQDAENTLSTNKDFKGEVQRLYKNVEADYIRSGLNSIIKERYNKDIVSYLEEDLGYTPKEALIDYYDNPSEVNKVIISNLLSSFKEPEANMNDKEWLAYHYLSGYEEMNSFDGKVLNNWNAQDFNKYVEALDSLPEEQKKQAESILKVLTGVPYAYAFKDYGQFGGALYMELSSTYMEQPIEKRISLVQSGNKVISEMYKKLTQIAFDSGKMSVEDFKAIMGNGYCKKADCFDKLCVQYKLLCCYQNYFSPNC